MTNSKTVSISLPTDMVSRIDAIAANRYKAHNGKPNRSQLILDAIAMYFTSMPTAQIDKLRDLEIQKRISSLDDRYQAFAGSRTVSVEAKTILDEIEKQLAGSGHSLLNEAKTPLAETDPKLVAKRLEVAGRTTYLDAISQREGFANGSDNRDAISQGIGFSSRGFTNANAKPPLDAGSLFPGSSLPSIAYQFQGKPMADAKSDPVIIAWMRLFPGLEAEIDNGHVIGITGTDRGYRLTVTPDLDPAIDKGLRWLGITLDTHTDTEP